MVCNGGRGGSMAWMREVVGCGLGWNGTIVVVGRLVHQAHGGGSARGWRHGKGKAARHGKIAKINFIFFRSSTFRLAPVINL